MRLLISFIGIDGSGKTTFAIGLYRRLKTDGFNSSYFHVAFSMVKHISSRFRKPFWGQISPLSNDVTIKGFSLNKGARKGFVLLFLGLALIDSLITYLTKIKFKKTILIYDRYFYDYLVIYFDICPEWARRLYLRLIPKPNLVFFLDVSPSIAYERNKEYSLSFYYSQRRHYLNLLNYLKKNGDLFIVNTNASIEEGFSLIYKRVKKVIQRNGDTL